MKTPCFEARVSHSVTVLSLAAGNTLSMSKGVDPPKGTVLLNYGRDETGETVAVATILTMVRKLDQSDNTNAMA